MSNSKYNTYRNKWRKRRLRKLHKILGSKCERCGSTENLHFDHIDPKTKKFRISKMIDAPEDVLMAEVKKCRILCDPCHRQKTLENDEYGTRSAHGTLWRYKKYKCRCDECKAAMREYNAKKRQKALKNVQVDMDVEVNVDIKESSSAMVNNLFRLAQS